MSGYPTSNTSKYRVGETNLLVSEDRCPPQRPSNNLRTELHGTFFLSIR